MFLYPWNKLESDADKGDLFVCHLAQEAKPIHDPENYLPKLKEIFRFRSNYESDRKKAVDLGWFLARFGTNLNLELQAKRTLWCIRTILISISAERREPVFAPQVLAQRTKSDAARRLLLERHDPRDSIELSQFLRAFLEEESSVDRFHKLANEAEFKQRFIDTSNRVALKTMDQEAQSLAGYM